MRIEVLENDRLEDFIKYCKMHKMEIDDSFLYDEDLRNFRPDDENPTYVAIDEDNKIKAVASLIVDEYNRRGKKGRFRIFHSEIQNVEYYDMLFKAILKHAEGLDKLNVFVPLLNKELMEMMETLSFDIERHIYLLIREDFEVTEYELPEGYEIKAFRRGKDEEAWCEVRNSAFANLKGNETHVTPEQVCKMVYADEYIEGGLMILYHNEKPIGVVRGSKDEHEGMPIMNIGPLAIMPQYQGRGLGRNLLRASIKFAKDNGYDRTILCVNADNERAKALYIQEGFNQIEGVACYKYDLTQERY
ncbi:GNAT family N-acetyltransferase [Lutispora thermophila]|uniref:Mycothiol synthase n=1 Tax=Lutispora thermophila DSM 19022 TaxID=1122184 RepID=A0A1M6H280_9FIRM|nr:GNAT family N-acetyltransferase [Lutispora thermophila]SHJ16333.1 mycothiol synthase [Lutispora thermophila DSM 19022]